MDSIETTKQKETHIVLAMEDKIEQLQTNVKEKDELIFAYDAVRSPIIDKTIIELQAEKEIWLRTKKDYDEHCVTTAKILQENTKRIQQDIEQIKQLENDLLKYGLHLDNCPCYIPPGKWSHTDHHTKTDDELNIKITNDDITITVKCTCGFEKALGDYIHIYSYKKLQAENQQLEADRGSWRRTAEKLEREKVQLQAENKKEFDDGFLEGAEAQEAENREHIIKQLEAEIKELKERIELALDDLPESPNKAIAFLQPALKGK